MKTVMYLGVNFFFLNCCLAQPGNISLQPIPASLKENAHAVVQESQEVFEIKGLNKGIYKTHSVVTILDEQGRDYLNFWEYTDKFHQLEEVEIKLFNSQGLLQKKITKKDLLSSFPWDGLVTDSKLYYSRFSTNSYPVTVEVSYEVKYNGLLQFPSFNIQHPYLSVVSSSFTCIVSPDIDIRYKAKNIDLHPVISTDKNKKIYTWSVKQMGAGKYEEGSVSNESAYPKILIAPNHFELDGNEGDMTSWEKFGEWYRTLAKDANNLPEDKKQVLRQMVANAKSDKEKTKIIYEYLQKNFRYVSIQLGIGGYKPFEASFVDEKKYGDCKALSNYTQACLDAVGVKSYQALINAQYNKEPVDPNFPLQAFNHVILCVPLPGDTVWLECTSNTNEFGVLGNFTENRNALLITASGGKLVPTPVSKSKDNKIITHSNINLEASGSGQINIDMISTGEYKSSTVLKDTKVDQKKYLVNELGFLTADDFTLTENDQKSDAMLLVFQLEKIPDFIAGKKMFLHPRLHKLWSSVLPNPDTRTKSFYLSHPFIKTDTTEYNLPQGFTVEALPTGKKISCRYADFFSSCSYDKNNRKIVSVAHLELKNYIIPADGYKEAALFFEEVLSEYAEKIIIKQE